MRYFELLVYTLAIGLAVAYALQEFFYCFIIALLIVLFAVLGFFIEGLRFFQYFYLVAFSAHLVLIIMDVYHIVPLIIYCTFLTISILSVLLFGCSDFRALRSRINKGPYQVGHKDIHNDLDHRALSVYYPMDKDEYEKTLNSDTNTYWIRYGHTSLKGFSAGTAAWGSESGPPPWFFRYAEAVRMDVVQDGTLAQDFREGKKPLIPIIYSHGLTGTRTTQSGTCRDLASHGYIVFAIDHHDGTANVSKLKTGEELYWTSMVDKYDKNMRLSQLAIRQKEISTFIDCLTADKFQQDVLNFEATVNIDLSRLVLGGHSMGGITCIETSRIDDRIKALFTLDPWLWKRKDEIDKGELVIKQPQFHIVTEHFPRACEEVFDYDTSEYLAKMVEQGTAPERESVILKDSNHFHQTDAIIIIPIETYLKGGNKPQLNYPDIYLLNSKCILTFLNKIGFNSSFEYSGSYCKEQMDDLREDYLDFKMEYNPTPNGKDEEERSLLQNME